MPCTLNVNFMTAVHKDSGGMVTFMPDVCLTPAPPAPPIPIPYPNIAMSTDTAKGSKKVKVDGNPIMLEGSNFSQSSGDEAGATGGVVSAKTKGKAEFINFSFDVKVEGKGVPRLADMMLGNKGGTFNTPPMAEVQAPLAPAIAVIEDPSPDKIEVTLLDGAGNPLKDVKYILKSPDGTKQEGKTDGSGKAMVEEIAPGLGEIVFPDLDGDISEDTD